MADDAYVFTADWRPAPPPPRWVIEDGAGGEVHPWLPPEDPHDGEGAMGEAFDEYPSLNLVSPNMAGLARHAINGTEPRQIPPVSLPYGPEVAYVRPGQLPDAREFRPTLSWGGWNDLRITRGPARHAQPVATLDIDRTGSTRRWAFMRPQPITRHPAPLAKPRRPATLTRILPGM